ncbi:4Fe-4S dicluster domain-containing protein, partial [Thermodesulfobacteriota bacterium]
INPDGKRDITSIKGSNFSLPADTVIVATGQTPETIQQLKQNENKNASTLQGGAYATRIKGVYAAGDYLTGPTTVIEAVNTGRKAAKNIAEDLIGKVLNEEVVRMEETETTDRKRAWDFIPVQTMPRIMPVEKRLIQKTLEVETGFTQETALEESKRCYLCFLHYEIDIERCIYCRYCIDAAPRDCIKMVDEIKINRDGAITGFTETSGWGNVNAIVIDNSRCIRCGECVRVCPVDCISVTRVELTERKTDAG